MPEPQHIGRIAHYFDHLKVAVITLEKGKKLKVGDKIRIEGGETNFKQVIDSLEVERAAVKVVKAGDDFGTRVKEIVREGYRVYIDDGKPIVKEAVKDAKKTVKKVKKVVKKTAAQVKKTAKAKPKKKK